MVGLAQNMSTTQLGLSACGLIQAKLRSFPKLRGIALAPEFTLCAYPARPSGARSQASSSRATRAVPNPSAIRRETFHRPASALAREDLCSRQGAHVTRARRDMPAPAPPDRAAPESH